MVDTNVADLAWKSSGGLVKRTNAQRHAEVFNVKDWGAQGDGTTDDRVAIQACIDYVSAGIITGNGRYVRGAIYFPPGDYRIGSFFPTASYPAGSATTYAGRGLRGESCLFVNLTNIHVIGGSFSTQALRNFCMFGDSSATTRIFYDGPLNSTFEGPPEDVTGDPTYSTTLMMFDEYVAAAVVRGLHFDMTPATGGDLPDPADTNSISIALWNAGFIFRAGSQSTFQDCKFSGATFGLAHSGKLLAFVPGEGMTQGAECTHLFCKFVDCWKGWCSLSSNALDHVIIGGYAKNCTSAGILAAQGAFVTAVGIEFAGNTPADGPLARTGDICQGNNGPGYVVACNSTSQDFAPYMSGLSYFAANYHHSATPGIFHNGYNNGVYDGNWSTNSRIALSGHGGSSPPVIGTTPNGPSVHYFRANRFDRSDWISDFIPGKDCGQAVAFNRQVLEPCPWDMNYANPPP